MRKFVYYNSSYSAVRPFIIQINSGADGSFTIPTTGGGYNYNVSTSDGQNFTGVTGNLTITFPDANTLYDISISGDFPRFYVNSNAERLKLRVVKQWGDIEWKSFELAFTDCVNLQITATDVPNLASVTNWFGCFARCTSIHLSPFNIGTWDMSSAIYMNQMFDRSSFNQDVSNWDVSSVTTMHMMFYQCSDFATDIDFSEPITGSISLTNISGMMAGTKSEKLLLRAGNLLSPINVAGNPSNWIASPNMKEVKLIGMKNDVDTTVGYGVAGAMTGKAWTDLLESFDISQSKTYKLYPTHYSDMETYVQGLGYTDIPDYLVNTGNNWTVIS